MRKSHEALRDDLNRRLPGAIQLAFENALRIARMAK
jgi:hypothetical protein